jgi:hypothetical protein
VGTNVEMAFVRDDGSASSELGDESLFPFAGCGFAFCLHASFEGVFA